MDINYFGIVNITKALLPGMIRRGSGHLVNISSASGFLASYGYSAYAPSKYAVAGFSDILRSEMKPYGIKVSIVFPTDVDTPQLAYDIASQPLEALAMAPFRTVMAPEEAARKILRGIARDQYYILPGADSKFMYAVTRFLGTAFYPLFDIVESIMIRRLLRQQKRKQVR